MSAASRVLLKRFLVFVGGLLMLSMATVGAQERVIDFDIPSQSLSSALDAFARQSGIHLLYNEESLGDARSAGLKGRFTVRDGLGRLLRGTGAGYSSAGEDSVVIKPLPGENGGKSPANEESTTVVASGRTLDLGTIVVSNAENPVEALPVSTTVITGSEVIDRSSLLQGVDILRTVPGLQVSTLNQGAMRERIIMRGFVSAGEAVAGFLDGVPLNELNGNVGGTIDLSMMIPEEIDRIEVIKGPFSALYGNYARAGAINFVTKNRTNESVARISLGPWNTQRAAVTMGRVAEERSEYYAVDFYHSDGFRRNSETLRTNMSARWTFDLSPNSSIRVGGRSYAAKWDAPGYLTQDEWDAGQWQESNTDLNGGEKERYDINLNYNYRLSNNDSLGLTVVRYSSKFQRWQDNGSPQTEQYDLLTATMVRALYSKQGSLITANDSLLLGLDVLREDGERRVWNNTTPWMRSVLTTDGEFGQTSYSAYAQAEMRPTERLTAVLGLRYDTFDVSVDQQQLDGGTPTGVVLTSDNDLSTFSPKFGLSYSLSPAYELYGNVGSGFFLPSPFDKLLNPDLKPVDLISYEVGLRFRPAQGLRGSLAFYRIDTEDDVTRDGPTGPLVNRGDVRRQGVDAEIMFDITDDLMFVGSASYIDAEFQNYVTAGVDFSGNVPTEIPPYFYSARLDYFNPGRNVGARLSMNGKGEVWMNNANTFRYESYIYTDAQIYYIDGPYTYDLKFNNITNERYAEYVFSGTAPGSQRYGPSRPFNVLFTFKAEF